MTILDTALAVGLLALGGIAGRYADGYWRAKGQNAATKDDIGAITRLIERAKAESARDLEAVRGAISTRMGIARFRYEREFEMLLELTTLVVRLQHAALDLRGRDEWDPPPGESEQERRTRVERSFREAHTAFRAFEPRRVFIDAALEVALLKFHTAVYHELRASHGGWSDDRASREANASAILEACRELRDSIRKRVTSWENLQA